MVARGNYASTDNTKTLQSWRNYFIFRADEPDVYATRWISEHPFTESNVAFRQETRMISSHRFADPVKLYCAQNSERLLGTLVTTWRPVEKRSQAVELALFRWTHARRTGWFPFCGVAQSGRVSRKRPDKEANWYLRLSLMCQAELSSIR